MFTVALLNLFFEIFFFRPKVHAPGYTYKQKFLKSEPNFCPKSGLKFEKLAPILANLSRFASWPVHQTRFIVALFELFFDVFFFGSILHALGYTCKKILLNPWPNTASNWASNSKNWRHFCHFRYILLHDRPVRPIISSLIMQA